jgi:hypothetical protein
VANQCKRYAYDRAIPEGSEALVKCHAQRAKWRKLLKNELNDLNFSLKYYSGDQIEKNMMDGASSTYGERRGAERVLVGKPDGKRPLRRPRPRWEDNIKMDLQEVECGGMD